MTNTASPLKKTLIRSGLVVSAGLVLGRISGFVRELILASQVGVSEQADVAVLVLTYPDFLISLFIGGAMSAAFIPELYTLPPETHRRFFTDVLRSVGITFLAISGILFAGSRYVTWLLAPGLDAESTALAADLLAYTTLAIPLVALAAVTRCFLQAKSRFALISLENFIYNLVLIVGLGYFYPLYGAKTLAIMVLCGAMIRFGPQWLLTLKTIPRSGAAAAPESGLSRKVLRRYFEALGAGTILVSLPIIARSFGSLHGEGTLAVFNYAQKLVEVPTAIVISASSLVLLPQFASHFQDDPERAVRLVKKVFVRLVLLSAAISLYISWFLWGLTGGEYTLTKLTGDELAMIALLSIVGISALPAKALIYFNIDLMTAKKDTRSPFVIALGILVLSFPLLWYCGKQWELWGVFFAMSAIYWLTWGLGLLRIRSHHRIEFWPRSLWHEAIGKGLAALIVPFLVLLALDQTLEMSILMRFLLALSGGLVTVSFAFWTPGQSVGLRALFKPRSP